MQMSETVQWRWQCTSPNWSWSSNTLATWWKEPTYWKRPWCWEDWRREEKGTTKDEMVGWHHLLDGQEFERARGEGEGQGSLACCSPWGWTRLCDWTTVETKKAGRTSEAVPEGSVVSDSLRPHGLQPPDASVQGIFQARLLEWVATSYSNFKESLYCCLSRL